MALMSLIYLMKIWAALLLYFDANLNLWTSLSFNMKVLITAVSMIISAATLMATSVAKSVITGASWLNSAWKRSFMTFIICCSLFMTLSAALSVASQFSAAVLSVASRFSAAALSVISQFLATAFSVVSQFSVIIQLMTFMKLYWSMLVVVPLISLKDLNSSFFSLSFFSFLSYFSSSSFSASVYSSSSGSFNLAVMNRSSASLCLGGLCSLIMCFYDGWVLSHTCTMGCVYMLGLLIMLTYSDEPDSLGL